MRKKEVPDGSIIVAENYGPDLMLMSLSIIYKVRGCNPKAGDWMSVSQIFHRQEPTEAILACLPFIQVAPAT